MRVFCFLGGANLTDSDDFYPLFSAHGKITGITIPRDPATGKTKGYGFIEMPNKVEAEAAVKELHGAHVGKRKITVSMAHGRKPRAPVAEQELAKQA